MSIDKRLYVMQLISLLSTESVNFVEGNATSKRLASNYTAIRNGGQGQSMGMRGRALKGKGSDNVAPAQILFSDWDKVRKLELLTRELKGKKPLVLSTIEVAPEGAPGGKE